MMVRPGNSYVIDEIRAELINHHPQIKILDTDYYYSMEFFNRANDLENILLTIDHWRDVHPSMVTIPVDWNYQMPYGLLYMKEPSVRVKSFISCIQNEKLQNMSPQKRGSRTRDPLFHCNIICYKRHSFRNDR